VCLVCSPKEENRWEAERREIRVKKRIRVSGEEDGKHAAMEMEMEMKTEMEIGDWRWRWRWRCRAWRSRGEEGATCRARHTCGGTCGGGGRFSYNLHFCPTIIFHKWIFVLK
jgi:hypothetical protein